MRSLIDKETAKKLNATGGQFSKVNLVASLADNTETQIEYEIEVLINFNDSNIPMIFYIMENLSHKVLLGTNFLEKINIKFLINNKVLLNNLSDFKTKIGEINNIGLNNCLNSENII